jgi:hypothetical protein
MLLGPACHRQANSRGFRANRRKSKSRRPQSVVVFSEECRNMNHNPLLKDIALILTAFVAFVVGMIIGAFGGAKFVSYYFNIGGGEVTILGRSYSQVLFEKYKNNEIDYFVRIDLLNDAMLEVAIVPTQDSRLEYGFVECKHPVFKFWTVQNARFTIERYDRNHLFVTLRNRYASTLPRYKKSVEQLQ